jgi:NDP-sugar pyrophosphorylase family protein
MHDNSLEGVTAVMLSGGMATRLMPITKEVPKAMLPIAGEPLIRRVVDWLVPFGVKDFVPLLGRMSEQVISYLDTVASELGVRFQYSIEDPNASLESAGALKYARHLIEGKGKFLFTNGDNVTNIDVRQLCRHHADSDMVTMALIGLRSPYGVVDTEGDRVIAFREKPILPATPMNPGIYCMSDRIFEHLPDGRGSLEKKTFPELAAQRKVGHLEFQTPPFYWWSVKTESDQKVASEGYEKFLSGHYETHDR